LRSFRKMLKARVVMAKRVSRWSRAFSTCESLRRRSKAGIVILLGLSLALVSPLSLSGQTNQQQQEQQQREEQQRQEQAREQQQREQQERDRQAREEQQRQEQQREELQRQQERQRQTPTLPVHSPTETHPSVNSPVVAASPSNVRDDLRHKPCLKEPCTGPQTKPVAPEPVTKLCNGKPCPVCAPGQSPGKDSSCVPATQAKATSVPAKPAVVPQVCAPGQLWNGSQCLPIAAQQQCSPGQTRIGSSCQADCTLATAGAQNYIAILRMARQDKDSACRNNPTSAECRSAESTYQMRIAEYRNYLGGVAMQCTLPDPTAI
jgi:flagellar motor protein MotB